MSRILQVKQVFPNNNWKGDFIEERLNVSLNELSAENAEILHISQMQEAVTSQLLL